MPTSRDLLLIHVCAYTHICTPGHTQLSTGALGFPWKIHGSQALLTGPDAYTKAKTHTEV
jgi:hypothetical protein